MTPADLKSARHALGLSVNEMADALRLGANGHTAIREMERGKREISGPVSVAVELMVERVGLEFAVADAYSDEGRT